MSDTPRTDKAEKFVYGRVDQKYVEPCEMRQLERELTEAQAKCGKLEQLRMDWMETARLSQDRASSNFNELMASQAREAQLREALKPTIIRAYTAGASHGHNVTVEGGYVDIHFSDADSYYKEEAYELLNDGTLPEAKAALTLPPPPVVPMEDAQSLFHHAESILDLMDRCGIDETPSDFSEEYNAP